MAGFGAIEKSTIQVPRTSTKYIVICHPNAWVTIIIAAAAIIILTFFLIRFHLSFCKSALPTYWNAKINCALKERHFSAILSYFENFQRKICQWFSLQKWTSISFGTMNGANATIVPGSTSTRCRWRSGRHTTLPHGQQLCCAPFIM